MHGTDLSILYKVNFSYKLIKSLGYLIAFQIACKY